jgi:hypothetical protein
MRMYCLDVDELSEVEFELGDRIAYTYITDQKMNVISLFRETGGWY